MVDKQSKNARVLDLYERLCAGKVINKAEESRRFGVDERSIQRDIDDIRAFLDERANIFSQFLTKEITLFGDGIGRYSAAAYRMGKDAITDQQYLLTVYETGYWGCLGYGIIILAVIIKGLKSFSANYFELTIILFYLLAMSGANCLSSFGQHIAIFWVCCGRIYNGSLLHDKKRNMTVVYDRI